MSLPWITEGNRRWWVLATMTGALAMLMIDATVVSVALPTIQGDLDASQTELQWVMNAYLLAIAGLVAVGGRLGEIYGHGRMFNVGAIVFVAASAAAGLAQSDTWLIVARAIQGVGAATMVPPSQAIVANSFPASERGRAMGIYAGISMIGLALGPLLGGVLTEGLTWRAVFYINLPIGIGMVALALVTVPRDSGQPQARVDFRGLATLVPGLTAIILALMQATTWGWSSPATIALLAGGAGTLVAFAVIERRVPAPLLQLRLFASRAFSAAVSILFLVQFALMGLTVFGAIWIQNVLGYGPIEAGLTLLPITLPPLVVAPLAGRAYDRIGPRALVGTGAALTALGFGWCAAVLGEESYALLLPGYLAIGIGMGQIATPANTDAMNSALPELRGEASGAIQTLRMVGGTVGLAVIGTIVAGVQSSKLTSAAEAITAGVSTAYWLAAALMLVASIAGWAILRRTVAVDAAPVHAAHPIHGPAPTH